VAVSNEIKDEPDFLHPLSKAYPSRRLARALLNGSILGHLGGVFEESDCHIVGLVEVVLCVDTWSKAAWLRDLEAARIYEPRA